MRGMVALALKDLLVLVRVRSGLFFTFVWPLIVCVMFGLVFAGQTQSGGRGRLRIAVVDEDNTSGSKQFIDRLTQSGDFTIDLSTRDAAENQVRRGQQAAYVVLKGGFGESAVRIFYGAPRRIEIGSDPARAAEAGMIEGLLTKYAMQDMQKLFSDREASRKMVGAALGEIRKTDDPATLSVARFLGELDAFLNTPAAQSQAGPAGWQPLEIATVPIVRQHENRPANAYQVTFPQGVVWGIIGCVMTFAISLVTERVRGTFVRLQVAPLTRAQVLGGKALGCAVSMTVLQVVLFTMGALAFGVRPASNLLLVAACLSASAAFVGFMMMIASLGKTEQAVAGAGWAMLMPMAMLGGAMIPQFAMPSWMLTIGNVSPIKWTILAMEGALWRGFTPAEMLTPCAILVGFGALCFAIGVRGLREA